MRLGMRGSKTPARHVKDMLALSAVGKDPEIGVQENEHGAASQVFNNMKS
jgi:hypothetical protein